MSTRAVRGYRLIVAGIDVGHQTTKVVILKDGSLQSRAITSNGTEQTEVVAERTIAEALQRVGLTIEQIESIVSTGVGKGRVPFANSTASEPACGAMGANWLIPSARTVIDVGAESSRVVRCGDAGNVLNLAMNDKCAAGAGVFLETIATAMEVDIKRMGELALQSKKQLKMSSTCAVFALTEVVSLVHAGVNKVDIIRAAHDSIARRLVGLLATVGMEPDAVMVGGAARNVGLVGALKSQINLNIIVPENPEIVVALGAAALAQRRAEQ